MSAVPLDVRRRLDQRGAARCFVPRRTEQSGHRWSSLIASVLAKRSLYSSAAALVFNSDPDLVLGPQ